MCRHIVQTDTAYCDSGAVAARQGLPTQLCKSEATDGLHKLNTELTTVPAGCVLFMDV